MRSIDELDVQGRRVLVRVDFNVPLTGGGEDPRDGQAGPGVADDTRIVAALQTIEELRRRGARLVLVSHLGRPNGHFEKALSMVPVAERLRELMGARVTLAPGVVGEQVKTLTEQLHDGEVLLLENVRFEEGETSNAPAFARQLADLADVPRRGTSTTPLVWLTARTPAPRASRTCCRTRLGGCWKQR